MPQTYTVGQHFTTTPSEKDAQGNTVPIPNPGALEWQCGNANIVNPGTFDPTTGKQQWTSLAAGTTSVTVIDTGENPVFSFADTVTIIDPPTSITFAFGSPS